MGAKIHPKSEKGQKKGMPQIMLKSEAEKNGKNHRISRPWSIQGSFFGQAGGRGEDFGPYLADFILTLKRRAPQAGCGGCFLLKKRPLDALGAPYFVILLDF